MLLSPDIEEISEISVNVNLNELLTPYKGVINTLYRRHSQYCKLKGMLSFIVRHSQ